MTRHTNYRRAGIGGLHYAGQGVTCEWLTPPAMLAALGRFDLDPCAARVMPWPTARTMWTRDDDGLSRPFFGRVWLNPPYGRETGIWLRKLAKHGKGTALIFARTETSFFQDWAWPHARAMLFLRGRINFHLPSGDRSRKNAGAPSVLIAYGAQDAASLRRCGISGHYVPLQSRGAP